jgi:hypothetical protein
MPREVTSAPRVADVWATEEEVGVVTVGTFNVVNNTSAPYEVPTLFVA